MTSGTKKFAAFVSFPSRYRAWARHLHANLQRCLDRQVFLDEVDIGLGRSFVARLQQGLADAERVVLVVSPESFASPWVVREVDSFQAMNPEWVNHGQIQLALLVSTPLPPFLKDVRHADFCDHDPAKYAHTLRELVGSLQGATDGRTLPALAADLEIPDPPQLRLPPALRNELLSWMVPVLTRRLTRHAVLPPLGLDPRALDESPSWACAASTLVVRATGDDDACVAALRIIDVLREELEEEPPERIKRLLALRAQIEEAHRATPATDLLKVYKDQVARDHERLVHRFQAQEELALLNQVYVSLELSSAPGPAGTSAMSIEDLLGLDPEQHCWVTHRWTVRGDPGSGKTTLLRHLAASLARNPSARWVPVFASLPRMVREREFLLDRIAGSLRRAGYAAEALQTVLDAEGRRGRLLLLIDGLDEVDRSAREDAAQLLRELAAKWPGTPLVVTTRPIGYERPDASFREVDVMPLDRERRRAFLARWFGYGTKSPDWDRADRALSILDEGAGLSELSGNPLYLTLMALLMGDGKQPDSSRTRLYDQVLYLLLNGKHRPENQPMECIAATRDALRFLGLEMTRDNSDHEPVDGLERRLYKKEADPVRAELQRCPRYQTVRTFLDELAMRTGIIGPHDGMDADWRFWHRTFREALAAEALAERLRSEGEAAILAHARSIKGDESRWAEPYALLVGRVAGPDALVKALVQANRSLGLRAMGTAANLSPETMREILALGGDGSQRAEVYARVIEQVGDPERGIRLLSLLGRQTTDENDRRFIDEAMSRAEKLYPDHRPIVERMRVPPAPRTEHPPELDFDQRLTIKEALDPSQRR